MNNKTKISLFTIFILLIFTIPTNAIPIKTVSKDKIWSVTFNSDIKFTKDNLYNNIIVKDLYNNEIPIYVCRTDNNILKIIPQDDYKEGNIYSLSINKNLQSENGLALKQNEEIIFQIEGQRKLNIKEIIKKQESVCYVKVDNPNEEIYHYGSGFVIDSKGIIVTNHHVIKEYKSIDSITVTIDGKVHNVEKIIKDDSDSDISILQLKDVDKELPTLKLADSDIVEVGDKIYTLGNPLEYINSISQGIVSGFRYGQGRISAKDIQFTAPISGGSSGGVLLNEYGEVIGIVYASASNGQNINFAIPINELKYMLNR